MGHSGKLYFYEVFDVLSSTTILGVFYGITFSLYCLCARPLYLNLQNPGKRRHAMFSLGFISLLLFCATGCVAMNARIIQLAYVDHADSPGGPYVYESLYGSAVRPYQTMDGVLELIIVVLTMSMQVGDQPNLSMLVVTEHITVQ